MKTLHVNIYVHGHGQTYAIISHQCIEFKCLLLCMNVRFAQYLRLFSNIFVNYSKDDVSWQHFLDPGMRWNLIMLQIYSSNIYPHIWLIAPIGYFFEYPTLCISTPRDVQKVYRLILYLKFSRKRCNYLDLTTAHNENQYRYIFRYFTYLRNENKTCHHYFK